MSMDIDPVAFSRAWERAWNAHDVEAVLTHFDDSVVFTSPVLERQKPETKGEVRGKAAVRDYWTAGLRIMPDLHFSVVGIYSGIDTLVINYRNQNQVLVSEVLRFENGVVVEGHGTYWDAER